MVSRFFQDEPPLFETGDQGVSGFETQQAAQRRGDHHVRLGGRSWNSVWAVNFGMVIQSVACIS